MCRSLNPPSCPFWKRIGCLPFPDIRNFWWLPWQQTAASQGHNQLHKLQSSRLVYVQEGSVIITLSSSTVGSTSLLQTLLGGPRMPENKLYWWKPRHSKQWIIPALSLVIRLPAPLSNGPTLILAFLLLLRNLEKLFLLPFTSVGSFKSIWALTFSYMWAVIPSK